MESTKYYLNKSSIQFPTLLPTAKSNPKRKLRLELNLSSKSITTLKTPQTGYPDQSATPKAALFKDNKLKPSSKLLPYKSQMKPISIKPIDKTEILKFPISSEEVISAWPNLETWAINELRAYNQIHYFYKASKYAPNDFDDEKGDYKIQFGDDILYRYEILEILGKGSFGQVIKVQDHMKKKPVAIKIIKNRQRYTDQAHIEIELLKLLKEMDCECKHNIVRLEDNFTFRGHAVTFT